MGYFRRRIDRGRSRVLVRELAERACTVREPAVWSAIPARPVRKRFFLRFATLERSSHSERLLGIFHASYYAGISEHCPTPDAIRASIEWFGQHLPAPDLDERRAIFFFKSDATECMRRVWELAHLLDAAGVAVRMQLVTEPGRIVYEDEYQVAAIPWSRHTQL